MYWNEWKHVYFDYFINVQDRECIHKQNTFSLPLSVVHNSTTIPSTVAGFFFGHFKWDSHSLPPPFYFLFFRNPRRAPSDPVRLAATGD